MALLCNRVVLQVCRRNLYTTTKCLAKEEKHEPAIEKLTGLHKREVLSQAAGIDDPYNLNIVKRTRASTREKPFEVPSAYHARIVGCICQEDATNVSWMWIHEGEPRRCLCGHWFQLTPKNPL